MLFLLCIASRCIGCRKASLFVTAGSGDTQTIDLNGTDTVSPELSGADNDTVVGTLVDTRRCRKCRRLRENFHFVLTDTLVPPQPGELGITITREEKFRSRSSIEK